MGKWEVVRLYGGVGICGRLGSVVYVCCISMFPFEETRIYVCARVEWRGVAQWCVRMVLCICVSYGGPKMQNTLTKQEHFTNWKT